MSANCNCNIYTDIRGRCLPNTIAYKNWRKCPIQTDTAYWLIENEYEAYKILAEYGVNSSEYKNYCMKTFKISEKNWNEILRIYAEDAINPCGLSHQ